MKFGAPPQWRQTACLLYAGTRHRRRQRGMLAQVGGMAAADQKCREGRDTGSSLSIGADARCARSGQSGTVACGVKRVLAWHAGSAPQGNEYSAASALFLASPATLVTQV